MINPSESESWKKLQFLFYVKLYILVIFLLIFLNLVVLVSPTPCKSILKFRFRFHFLLSFVQNFFKNFDFSLKKIDKVLHVKKRFNDEWRLTVNLTSFFAELK